MSFNYKSNQVKLNIPNKVLAVAVDSIRGYAYWEYANGATDPWYAGSASRKYYQWEITMTVTPQFHGSHLTRDDFQFNGLDIVVGDWIAGATTGLCLKVISISAKTSTTVTCVVEDWLRYNTFRQPTGVGIFNIGPAVVFGLNENGLPMLDQIPNTVNAHFFSTVTSRFQYLNPLLNYVLEQPNHGLEAGDVVSVTAAGFAKANSTTMDRMIGVVVEPGPGPNFFMVSPNNRFVDFDPAIPGTQGDYIYVGTDGELTTAPTGQIAFLKVQDAVPTVLTGTVADPVIPAGHSITLNAVPLTFTGSGNIALSSIVAQINTGTANHSVVANAVASPTEVVSSADGTAYGPVGGYVPFSANINGVTVNFVTEGSQFANVATPEDMAIDINSAGIANLIAIATTSELTLKELNGNTITIVNVTNDAQGAPFVGNSNVSGLNAVTTGPGTQLLKLTRSDGGEILIYEGTEYFRINTGIASGHTGVLPVAMNLERGLRSGSSSVVATIAGRDSLSAQMGDQCYVLDKGNGEWGMYLYNGSAWIVTATQDSASVDAKTLSYDFEFTTLQIGQNSSEFSIGLISPNRKIIEVSVSSTIPLDPNATVQVGTTSNIDLLMPAGYADLSEVGTFVINPEYQYKSLDANIDMEVRALLTHYDPGVPGIVTIKVTYV